MAIRENEYVQESLLDLINQEHEIVSKINEINAEMIKAKKYNLRTNEYVKLMSINTKKLEEVRASIRNYFIQTLGFSGHENGSYTQNINQQMRRF